MKIRCQEGSFSIGSMRTRRHQNAPAPSVLVVDELALDIEFVVDAMVLLRTLSKPAVMVMQTARAERACTPGWDPAAGSIACTSRRLHALGVSLAVHHLEDHLAHGANGEHAWHFFLTHPRLGPGTLPSPLCRVAVKCKGEMLRIHERSKPCLDMFSGLRRTATGLIRMRSCPLSQISSKLHFSN